MEKNLAAWRWLVKAKSKKGLLYKSAETILVTAPLLLQIAVSLWLPDDRYRFIIAVVSVAYAATAMQQSLWNISPFEMAGYMALAGGVLIGMIMLSPLVLQRPIPRLQYIESTIAVPLGAVAFTLIGFLGRLKGDAGKQ